MGKASSSKKVSRVARTGGGRTKRGTTSWFWPLFIGMVVILGTTGVAFSKVQQNARTSDDTPPRAAGDGKSGDHWHAALGFNVCGQFLPDIADQADPLGIHSHGDGIVHIHPFRSKSAGGNATLGVYFDAVTAKVSTTEIALPGQDAKKTGEKCGDKPAQVRVKTWPSKDPGAEGSVVPGDPSDLRPTDGQLITIAFLPDGEDIPRPPSAPNLDKLTDVPGATTSTTPGSAPTTVGGDTTVPPDPSATTPPPTAPPQTAPPDTAPPDTAPPGTARPGNSPRNFPDSPPDTFTRSSP